MYGSGWPKNSEKNSRKKSQSAEICRTVRKKSHSISLYIETNYSLCIIESIASLNTCSPYLNTLTRLSALGSIS